MTPHLVTADPRHERLRDGLLKTLKAEASDLPADHILAVVSVLVGQVMALQDQRSMTVDRAWAIIEANIVAGNQSAVRGILGDVKGSA